MKNHIKISLFKRICNVLIIMFGFSFINIPYPNDSKNSHAEAATITGNVMDFSDEVDNIKILEVGPEYKSQLTGNTYSGTKIPVKEEKTVGSQKVSITYMDMPMFIAMVDDIEGKYDIVLISDRGGDYTAPQVTSKSGNASSQTTNGISISEYMTENDITNKRAKKIINMINKGQLVYIDNAILTSSSLKTTKLYKLFNDINKVNFIKESQSNITLSNMINKYNQIIVAKRPKINKVTKPQEQIKENRSLDYTVSLMTEDESKVKLKLYLDANGDGLYTEDELMEEQMVDASSTYKDYSLNYMLSKKYIGYLNWKIDAVIMKDDGSGNLTEGVKTDVESNVISKAITENDKKQINVLQIYPDSNTASAYGTNINNTKLEDNKTFNDKILVDDYKIKIDYVTVSDFCSKYNNTYSVDNLEKKYNMIIVGFADNYNEKDFGTGGIGNLKKYIEDGYSIMFTHDTMSSSINGNSGTRCAKLTRSLRDYLGQSRYDDLYRYNSTTGTYDNKDIIKTYNPETKSYDAKTIPHDDTKKPTLGQTDKGSVWNSTYSDKVKLINKAQITDYPYDISESNVSVLTTHTQWFQLNLEDEDVVPWYNMVARSGEDFKCTDARNYYYTYSKGNITYSGTGHRGVYESKIGERVDATMPDSEVKLFVNTIVKAYKGGNHRPVIENQDKDKNIIPDEILNPHAKRSEDFVFYTTASDEDLDKVKLTIVANGHSISNDDIEMVETSEKYDGGYINSDTLLKVTVNKEDFKDEQVGATFPVEVTATDDMIARTISGFDVLLDNSAPDIKSYDNSAFSEAGIDENKSMVNLCSESMIELDGTSDLSFISIPNDYDDDKMNVYIKTEGLSTETLGEYSNQFLNKESNDKLSVIIPKDYFKTKQKGTSFDVLVTVKDVVGGIESDSYTEKFTIKIGNHAPSLENNELNDSSSYVPINTDIDADGVDDAKYPVNSAKSSYSFLSKIRDIDKSDDLTLKVYCEDSTGEGYNEVAIYEKNATDDPNVTIDIPNKFYEKSVINDTDEDLSKYADKKRGERFKIKTVVIDSSGATSQHIFTAKIDDNKIPRIVAFENDGETQISENETAINKMAFGKSYKFYAKVNDLDVSDDLTVTASIDDIPRSFYTGSDLLETKVFKDGDKFVLEIPKDRNLLRATKFKVTLKVTDSYNDSGNYTFYVDVTANNAPVITNYENNTSDEISNGSTSINPISIGNMFLFDILPKDIDEDDLNVTVSVHDGDDIHKISYSNAKSNQLIQNVTIGRLFYLNKFKGDKFLVDVNVDDGYGGFDTKSFNVKIKDDNMATLQNYEKNGIDVIENFATSVNEPVVNSVFTQNDGIYALSDALEGEDYSFVTIPKDEDNEKLKVNVYINDMETLVNSYEADSMEKINVTIPRSFYKELKRGDIFKVIVTVSDNLGDSVMTKENVCETKRFTVKIKANENPVIENTDSSGASIDDISSIEATKEQDYIFNTNIADLDDEIDHLEIKCAGYDVFSDYVKTNNKKEITIPKSCYSTKNRGEYFDITVVAQDNFGGKVSKVFKVKIRDNELPTIRNFTLAEADDIYSRDTEIEADGSGGIAKTFKDYTFITNFEDKDDKVVDGQVTADDTVIYTGKDVLSYKDIAVTIPKNIYENKNTGEKVLVKVKVSDKNGGSSEKSFYVEIKANNPPKVNNYYSLTNIYNTNDTPSNEAGINKTEIMDKEIVLEKNEEKEEGYEFVTVPSDKDENDKNNLKLLVTADVLGQKTTLLDVNNAVSDKQVKVVIPKDLYKDLGKGEKVNISTTVTDLSGETDSKSFSLIINKAPTVFNKDEKGTTIQDNGTKDVTRYHDLKFYSVCDDIDEEEELNYKVFLQSENITELIVNTDQFGFDIPITIASEKFNSLNENEKMKVITIVTDSKGKSSQKSFYINMTNNVPQITNYEIQDLDDIEGQITDDNIIKDYEDDETSKNFAISQNKYLYFPFVSVVEDTNEMEELEVKAKATLVSDNISESEEANIIFKANGKELAEGDKVKSGTRLTAMISQSAYKNAMPSDYVKVEVSVTDEFGASSTSTFYLQIGDIFATVKHGILESEKDNSDLVIDMQDILTRVRTYDTVKFAGKATDVYCNKDGIVSLKLNVDQGIQVKGNVSAYRILEKDGTTKKSEKWNMTYDSDNNCYSVNIPYSSLTTIGKIEPEGMTILVRYDGFINLKSSSLQHNFTNKLFVNMVESDALVYTKDDALTDLPPMF